MTTVLFISWVRTFCLAGSDQIPFPIASVTSLPRRAGNPASGDLKISARSDSKLTR
jgi:hypothetical protein